MINLIAFCDTYTGIDWYYNNFKMSFIHMDKVDLSDQDFWTEEVTISEFIREIAEEEFKCSPDIVDKCLSVVVSEF